MKSYIYTFTKFIALEKTIAFFPETILYGFMHKKIIKLYNILYRKLVGNKWPIDVIVEEIVIAILKNRNI